MLNTLKQALLECQYPFFVVTVCSLTPCQRYFTTLLAAKHYAATAGIGGYSYAIHAYTSISVELIERYSCREVTCEVTLQQN